jgi:hypothetical protein
MVERQLDLLKGKRQKGITPPGPTEFEIHCTVADYLRNGLAPGWMWFHPANGELRNKATGGRLKRMGVKPGASDILLACAPFARLHALELKRKGEKLRADQREWMAEVVFIGGEAAWADSVEGAIQILTDWGAVSTRIHLQDG